MSTAICPSISMVCQCGHSVPKSRVSHTTAPANPLTLPPCPPTTSDPHMFLAFVKLLTASSTSHAPNRYLLAAAHHSIRCCFASLFCFRKLHVSLLALVGALHNLAILSPDNESWPHTAMLHRLSFLLDSARFLLACSSASSCFLFCHPLAQFFLGTGC